MRETFLRKSPQHPAHLDLLTPHLNLIQRAVMFHGGDKRVPAGAPAELDHGLPKESTVRVPHVTADIFGARPTDLNIVDGIRTIRGGEGHWNQGIGLKMLGPIGEGCAGAGGGRGRGVHGVVQTIN